MPENTRQREAFQAYWEMGAERSIEELQRVLARRYRRPPSLRTLYEWSRRNHWQTRLLSLEREAARADDEARVAALKEMAERHAQEGLLLQQKGAEWIAALGPTEASAEAGIRALVEGVKLERLARGEAIERYEQRPTELGPLEALNDEELEILLDHAERSLAGEGAPGPD